MAWPLDELVHAGLGALLPCTVRHSTLKVDLCGLLKHYQNHYPGAMYSGCGGGYLYIVSEKEVPGSFHANIRVEGNDE